MRSLPRGWSRRRPLELPGTVIVVADQGAVSATNFGVLVVAARHLNAADFGLVSLITAALVSLVGLAQAANVEPVTVEVSARGRWVDDARRQLIGRRQVVAGLPVAIGLGTVGVVAGGRWTWSLLALAAGLLPALLLDAFRAVDYCNDRPLRALRRDLAWIGLVVAGLAVLVAVGRARDPVALLAAYLGAAVIVGTPGLVGLARAGVASRGVVDDLGDRAHRRRYVTEFVTNQGASQLTYYLAAAVFGLGPTGSLRAAQSLFGPLNVVLSSLRLFLAPRLGRRLADDPAAARAEWRGLLRVMLVASVLAPAAVVLAVGMLGPALFGQAWAGLVPLIAPFGFQYVWLGVGMAGVLALRATASSRASMWCRVVQAVVTVVATVIGCIAGSLTGLCWLIAAGMGLAGLVWLEVGRRHVRDAARRRPAAGSGRADGRCAETAPC